MGDGVARRDGSMTEVLASPACTNCGAALVGPFCAQCGQRDKSPNPTVGDVVREAAEEISDVDGRLFRSMRALLTKPGFLTNELFFGRRASYVGPVRLYLTFSVLFFAVTAMSINPRLEIQNGVIDLGFGQTVFVRGDLTPEARAELIEDATKLRDTRTGWLPRLLFVLVPLAALLVMLVTPRSGRNYPQHLYFAMHVQAAVFVLLALGSLLPRAPVRAPGGQGFTVTWTLAWQDAFGFVLNVALVAYVVTSFRRVYGGGWVTNAVRTAVVGIVYAAFVLFALIRMTVYAIS
jgi:hypothetical protein